MHFLSMYTNDLWKKKVPNLKTVGELIQAKEVPYMQYFAKKWVQHPAIFFMNYKKK